MVLKCSFFLFQRQIKKLSSESGPEEWQCYHCITEKISGPGAEDGSSVKPINKSIVNELQSKVSDQWNETVEEITNQRIVKAQAYMKRLKNHQRHQIIENTDTITSSLTNFNEDTSIFNNVNFPLKLAPSAQSDIS